MKPIVNVNKQDFVKIGLVVIAISSVLTGKESLANTSVYVTSGLNTVSVDECIKGIKKIFNDAGFTDHIPPAISDDKTNAWFYADKPGTPYAVAAECSSESGTYGIGISGINDDETRSEFIKMITD